jgi:predicted O-methyltransferase YrrM
MKIVNALRRLIHNSDASVRALDSLSIDVADVQTGLDNQSDLINRKFGELMAAQEDHIGKIVRRIADVHMGVDKQWELINGKMDEFESGHDDRNLANTVLEETKSDNVCPEWKVHLRDLTAVVPLDYFGSAAKIDNKVLEEFKKTSLYRDFIHKYFAKYPTTSLMSDDARAVLYSLVRLVKPDLVAEIGTFYGGTAEVIVRALFENGNGLLCTCDPFDTRRHPVVFGQWPRPLRDRIRFFPCNSMTFLSSFVRESRQLDIILIDGDHDYECASFDLAMSARVIRPGGIVVMDNSEQIGPFEAARQFLAHNSDWRELGSSIADFDPSQPFAASRESVSETGFLILQAPESHTLDEKFRSWGQEQVPSALHCPGFAVELPAQNCEGRLHFQAIYRGFVDQGQDQEEIKQSGSIAIRLDGAAQVVKTSLEPPLVSKIYEQFAPHCRHTFELELLWEPAPGSPPLKLAAPPKAAIV